MTVLYVLFWVWFGVGVLIGWVSVIGVTYFDKGTTEYSREARRFFTAPLWPFWMPRAIAGRLAVMWTAAYPKRSR